MPYYLAPYIGKGTRADPWRPRGSDIEGWSAIDLRAGAFQYALLHLPEESNDRGLRKLADDPQGCVSIRYLSRYVNDLDGSHFDQLVARLLLRPPVRAWNRLQAAYDRYEIWLGGLLWEAPVLRALITSDNFNRANETPMGSPWVSWVDGLPMGVPGINLSSNSVSCTTTGDKGCYIPGAVLTANHYSQATATTQPTNSDWGVGVRVSPFPYMYFLGVAAPGSYAKFGAGFNVISNLTGFTAANGDTYRIEVIGSTIRGYQNNVAVSPSSVTDTEIASGQPGLFVYDVGGAIDNWTGGDLKQSYYGYRRRSYR